MTEVLYFGCLGAPGHHVHSKAARVSYYEQPWRELDGGLLKKARPFVEDQPEGVIVYALAPGWSVISFWDRSVDARPSSNSAFLIRAEMPAEEILKLAREQWPEVFSRPKFPNLKL